MSFELLDEHLAGAALQDALAFVDTYMRSAPASTGSLVPPSSSSLDEPSAPQEIATVSPKNKKQRQTGKRPAKGCSKSHNRGDPKAELDRLRHDVKLLESTLTELKRPSEVSSGSNTRRLMLATWKTLALRQYQRRNQSELTNRKLKRALDTQLKVAKALETLLTKRVVQHDLDLVYESPAFQWEILPLSHDDPVSALLLNHVHEIRFEIDVHLINADLIGLDDRSLHTLSKTDLFHGTVQETTSSITLPLSLDTADLILWGGMRMHHRQVPGGPPYDFAYVENGVDKSFMTVLNSAHSYFNLGTRSVMRKFVDQHRTIYVWTSIATVTSTNIRIVGEGLIVLEPTPGAPFESTLLRNWHRLYVEEADTRLVPAFSAIESERVKVAVMSTLRSKSEEYFSSLENTLLDTATNPLKDHEYSVY